MNLGKLRTMLLVGVLAMAAHSPAPQKDKRTHTYYGERSGAALESDAKNNGAIGEIGTVQSDTDRSAPVEGTNSSEAKAVVSTANQDFESKQEAQNVLAAANQDLKGGKSTGFWMWSFLFVALGAGAVFALRQWANKVSPKMPESKSRW